MVKRGSCLSLPLPKGPDSHSPNRPLPAQKNASVCLALDFTILNMPLSCDNDFTDDPAKDGAKTSLCLVHLPAAALIMTINASFPPLGIVLVRMSPQIIFIYLSDQIA